ncbi:MAG: hypothetical protein ABEJ48_02910 [Halobacteriales archaeon]
MSDEDATTTDLWARETAPQSPYTMRQVTLGLIVLGVGLAITFVLPLVG